MRTLKRLAILTEGSLDIHRNKTALGLLRFRPEDVVCVIDSQHAGADAGALLGTGRGIPVVASVADAVRLGVAWVVIGVATPGGFLPPELRPQLHDAIRARVGVVSGLHDTLTDPNLISLAARYAVDLVNLRQVRDEDARYLATGQARGVRPWRIMTVGTDANIGKTTTALTLHRHLVKGGTRSAFVATGQDGILITGSGICIDRCISDFAAGAVEHLVLQAATTADVVVVEGQNAILSPCYSGTALSVLHGACPDAMILCHEADRTRLRHTDVPMPTLTHWIELYQAMLLPLHPGRVVGIALNTQGMAPTAARDLIAETARATGLPCADVVREGADGCARLATAARAPAGRSGKRPPRSRRSR
jgi:uncharacterized NAD-dependent epimerase/dehydratase family protein